VFAFARPELRVVLEPSLRASARAIAAQREEDAEADALFAPRGVCGGEAPAAGGEAVSTGACGEAQRGLLSGLAGFVGKLAQAPPVGKAVGSAVAATVAEVWKDDATHVSLYNRETPTKPPPLPPPPPDGGGSGEGSSGCSPTLRLYRRDEEVAAEASAAAPMQQPAAPAARGSSPLRLYRQNKD